MEFWIDGQWREAADAQISVLDHGLLYGDGIFEGIRAYGGRPFYLDAHLDRLEASAQALRLCPNLSRQALAAACQQMASRLGDGYLRLIVTRGDGNLGIDPASCPSARTILIGGPIAVAAPGVHERGARVITSSVRRTPRDVLDGRIKSLNYLPSVLARLEARAAGADEALMLNEEGWVAEGSADNVLCVRDGVLMTPSTQDGGLDGITRRVLLRLAGTLGIAVRETRLSLFDLRTASEVLLSGTGAEVIPVADVDGWSLTAPGPVTQMLSQRYWAHAAALAAGSEVEFDLALPVAGAGDGVRGLSGQLPADSLAVPG